MSSSRETSPPLERQAAGVQNAERVIASITARQHGIVTRDQLVQAGVPVHVVEHRVKTGRLQRTRRGVYRAGPLDLPRARELAAVLTSGEGAVLSHWSAAGLWRILPDIDATTVFVTTRNTRRAAKQGLCVRHVRTLRADEVTTHDSIPVTTPARTLYDLASLADHRQLERALAEALALRLTTTADVSKLVDRHAGQPGTRSLRGLLDSGTQPALTRSEAEERFLTLLRKSRLPDPAVNVRIDGCEVDFFWRSERFIVEVDGRAFHSSARAFERDRDRDAALLAAGFRVLRVTWRQIVEEPEALLVRLARALAAAAR